VVGIARQNMTGATAYVTPATYAGLPGQPGYADSYRIVTLDHAGPAVDRVARAISDALARATITTRINVTETMLRKDVDGHFDILIVALLFIAILMAAVGVFGLGSAMGNSVAERRREFGILRSIGARPAVVLRNVLVEGVFTGLLSVPLALLLALPLSAAIGSFLGNLLFGLPFPLVLALKPLLLWVALVTAGALAASALPALRAARMSIHETLAYL
jgi:putative ABC transport system permease protein